MHNRDISLSYPEMKVYCVLSLMNTHNIPYQYKKENHPILEYWRGPKFRILGGQKGQIPSRHMTS